MDKRPNKYEYNLSGASNASFFPFRRPCPICNQWIDCITEAHCAKHDMTRAQFIEQYCAPIDAVDVVLCPIDKIEGMDLMETIKQSLNASPGKWLYPKYAASKLGQPLQIVRKTLALLEKRGFVVSRVVKVTGGSTLSNTSVPHNEKLFTLNAG